MKRLLTITLLLLFFIFPTTAHADEGWTIDRFESDIAIQETGEVRIVETIEVNFGTLDKHGIYRDIPNVYESQGQLTYTDITVESVLQNDLRAKYEMLRNGNNVRIKIGDPDKTINGRNLYIITYKAKGILRSFANYDELYWNVTGNGWPVPIAYSEAIVRFPKAGIKQISCYEGAAGSTTNCQYTQESPQLARFQTINKLEETHGLTIAVGYSKGLFPILTVERPKGFVEKFLEWPSLTTLFFAIFFGTGAVFYRWYKHGRDYWFGANIFGRKDELGAIKPLGSHETVTVDFTPPEKLRPAEIGVLMDERADTSDVVATIIDLAGKGHLTITEIPKKWMFGSVDYELQKKEKAYTGLLEYEKLLLDSLFANRKSVKLSALKLKFYKELEAVKKALYQEVIDKKLFPSNPEKVRENALLIGILLLFLGIGGLITGGVNEWIFLADLGFGIIIAGVVLLIMFSHMSRRTAYGHELYRRARGYHLFINTAEKHRQKFFENKNMFNEVLPYAIVFGLTDKFAKQMKELGIEPSTTGWYTGVHPITSSNFAASMTGFSNSLSTSMASTPSSSGSGGGGSSGGGFGGGGGGSW